MISVQIPCYKMMWCIMIDTLLSTAKAGSHLDFVTHDYYLFNSSGNYALIGMIIGKAIYYRIVSVMRLQEVTYLQ